MLARGVRNVIYNYTDAQRKVRSATSNDAWGPSPALMHEIADLTDNVVAYAEIMPIVWKRLNDHGKNWRHVYKSLVLLDHLIKYGNERVMQQCKENIFSIQTLKDFQYVEDQKDQGHNVREKAKQLVALLKDDERLRNERRKAQEARERYVRQAMGMDSNGSVTYGRPTASTMRRNSTEGGDPYSSASYSAGYNSNQYPAANRSTSYNDRLSTMMGKDFVQPASQEEEQLQMQIALAESQREADDVERRRRNDELKMKMALERSVNEASPSATNSQLFDFNTNSQQLESSLFDTQPSNASYLPTTTASSIGWNLNTRPTTNAGLPTAINDPWALDSNDRTSGASTLNDPWQPSISSPPQANPWSGNTPTHPPHDTSLSINISDPWGLGATTTRPTLPAQSTTTATATSSNTINNELSDFFGAGATITPSYDQQPPLTSSNPWSVTNPSSTSPSYANLAMSNQGGSLLYPTVPSGSTSNGTSASPVFSSSALSTSRKTPESFLGDKFNTLVNLDQLVTDQKNTNPFGATGVRSPNPFTSSSKAPTLEQLSSSTATSVPFTSSSPLPPPLIPSSYNSNSTGNPNASSFNTNNPFL